LCIFGAIGILKKILWPLRASYTRSMPFFSLKTLLWSCGMSCDASVTLCHSPIRHQRDRGSRTNYTRWPQNTILQRPSWLGRSSLTILTLPCCTRMCFGSGNSPQTLTSCLFWSDFILSSP
jgi:hypothetical protein